MRNILLARRAIPRTARTGAPHTNARHTKGQFQHNNVIIISNHICGFYIMKNTSMSKGLLTCSNWKHYFQCCSFCIKWIL